MIPRCHVPFLYTSILLLSLYIGTQGLLSTSPVRITSGSAQVRSLILRNSGQTECTPEKSSSAKLPYKTLVNISQRGILLAALSLLPTKSVAEETKILTRADVGNIDLNTNEPPITDVCWLDVQIGSSPAQRVEISLYGTITPLTAANFKSLCLNDKGMGYKGSEFFRIISEFSVQGGSIGIPLDTPTSRRSRYGRSASGEPFPSENFKILHSYPDGGVISMTKDLTNAGKQDSRFFITLKSDASWGDGRYSAFGRVTKGMSLLQGMVILAVEPPSNYPKTMVKIVDAGCY